MYSPIFHKALIFLDEDKYEEGENCLKEAISQSENEKELIIMKTCYADFLCDFERYDEALENARYVVDNSEIALQYDLTEEIETAEELITAIENREVF